MKIIVCLLLLSAIFSLKSNLRILQNNLNSLNTTNATSSNETNNNLIVNATEIRPETSNISNNNENQTNPGNNTQGTNNHTQNTSIVNSVVTQETNTSTPSNVNTNVVSSTVSPKPQENPSVMSCVGNAGMNLESNRVRIEFKVDTLNQTATAALEQNSNITNKIITSLKNQGINDTSDIQTTSFSVNPKYDSVYNNTSKSYDTVFQGYTVSNVIVLTTLKKEHAGGFIDVAVKAGASVNSVNFDVSENIAYTAKMNLIKSAIEDCNIQFKNALDPIGYKVTGYKSIIINDFEGLTPINIPFAAFARTEANNNVKVFAGRIPVSTKINIEVTISK